MKGYMYTVNINQFAAVENGFNIDIIDLAIFDFFRSFANSGHCSKMDDPLGSFFQVQNSLIMQQIPLLKIKTDRGIAKRIDNLVKAGLLKKHPLNSKLNKTWYCFGSNYDKMLFYNNLTQIEAPQNESSDTLERKFRHPRTKVPTPQNESSDNNIYKDKFYKKKLYIDLSKFCKKEALSEEEKKERMNLIQNELLNSNEYHSKVIRRFSIKQQAVQFHLRKFLDDIWAKDDFYKPIGNIKTHFINWLAIKIEKTA
jgi:hypothetical protein